MSSSRRALCSRGRRCCAAQLYLSSAAAPGSTELGPPAIQPCGPYASQYQYSHDTLRFGYGSLVHSGTHDYEDLQPSNLTGWRRHWCATEDRSSAYLTAVPDPSANILGLVARVSEAEWASLDDRESAYIRQDIADSLDPHPEGFTSVITYRVPEEDQKARGDHAILLSYLDVVVQGYLQVFGPSGVDHFFATTSGWDSMQIFNDRADPQYPRHQTLDEHDTNLVDLKLAELSAKMQKR